MTRQTASAQTETASQREASLAAAAGQAGTGVGGILIVAGCLLPWVTTLGGLFQVSGSALLGMLIAHPVATAGTWGPAVTSVLLELPLAGCLLAVTGAAGLAIALVPSLVPARHEALKPLLEQGLPLFQLVVAALTGWGALVPLMAFLLSDAGLGSGLPTILAGSGLAALGSFGALLVRARPAASALASEREPHALAA